MVCAKGICVRDPTSSLIPPHSTHSHSHSFGMNPPSLNLSDGKWGADVPDLVIPERLVLVHASITVCCFVILCPAKVKIAAFCSRRKDIGHHKEPLHTTKMLFNDPCPICAGERFSPTGRTLFLEVTWAKTKGFPRF